MKPRSFKYVRPSATEEILAVLAQHREDARILAGGQSLVPMMNFRLVEPKLLVDISGLPSLAFIREANGEVEIGASITQAKLLAWPELGRLVPLVAAALPHVGHFQTRSRGTICGSIAHSDPSSEMPLCLAALGGKVVLQSSRATRVAVAGDFQTGMLSTARSPDEFVAAVRFPTCKPGTRYAFAEMAQRHGDLALCAVAAVSDGQSIRLAVGGVADRPTVREWSALSDTEIDDALNDFAWDLGPTDDVHATAAYRRELVRRLGRRVIRETTI